MSLYRRAASLASAAMLSIAALSGCNRDEPGSPGAAMRAVINAANERRYDDLERGLSADALRFLTTDQAKESGGLKAYAAYVTRDHTVASYRTVTTRIKGSEAIVDYELTYTGGETSAGPGAMVYEGGAWKIALYRPEGGEAWLQEK